MRTLLPLALGLVCLAAGVVRAQTAAQKPPSMFPFIVPWADSTAASAVDMSYLNAKPAGVHGFIVVKDGHFVESGTGQRIRFFGTNFTFDSDFPAHEDAEKVAAHLAKLGINIVRIHHHDTDSSSLWDKSVPGHVKFDPVAVDRLDYLLAQLKKNGVYVDLNLHVSRKFTAADGFPDSVKDTPVEFDKRIDNVDRRMIDLQKQFAHDYLTRVNPYTGLSYVDDPAVAIIEINNENTLAGWPTEGMDYFDKLPAPFRGEIARKWNQFLLAKYKTTGSLRSAWAGVPSTIPAGPTDLLSSSLSWRLEDRVGDVQLVKKSEGTSRTMPDVDVANPVAVDPVWHKQLHVIGLNFDEDGMYKLMFRARSDTERTVNVYIGLDQEDWHHIGMDAQAKVGPDWRTFKYAFQAVRVVPNHGRLSFILGANSGTLSLADVRISRSTAEDILPSGMSLEAGNLDLPELISKTQRADWRQFLIDAECAYADEMRAYVKDDLKAHGNVVDTQMDYGNPDSLKREAASDFADDHAYWQHPRFPGKAWDPANWNISNTPMSEALVKGDRSTFETLASNRPAGKPFTVSEYNHPAPSDYQSEMYPEIASFAALQDWDAVFQFDFGSYGGVNAYDRVQGFFALQGNPAKEPFAPAAALLFRAGLIAPLATKATLHLPADTPYVLKTTCEDWRAVSGDKAPNLLGQRCEMLLDPKVAAPTLRVSTAPGSSSASATQGPAGSQYIAQGRGAVAASGFFGGQTIRSGAVTMTFPAFGNNFASLILVALDGKPLAQSGHLLLTLAGKAENTGQVWNETRTSLGRHWGRGPAMVEGIPMTLSIAGSPVRRAWALGPTGERMGEVPVASGGAPSLTVGPERQTVWYEIGE